MDECFVRTGPLMELQSYPHWLQQIVRECSDARRGVVEHELFRLMSEGALPQWAMRRFLAGVWPVIEQFPQYMAMNLLKVQYGAAPGHEMGRKYLIRNIRVEQNHVEYWIEWAQAHAVSRDELLFGWRSGSIDALSHWCWHTCERDPLPAAMAATNYAIEGVTGEWAALVCSSPAYENGFPLDVRKKAMKWLRVHAQYDDTHPWEALEIIATIIGNRATSREVQGIQSGIRKSYEYMRMAFDDCLARDETKDWVEPVLAARTYMDTAGTTGNLDEREGHQDRRPAAELSMKV
jgi:pyrroloquinoline quinone (PQQ) biosynthesis protein C